MQLCKNVMIRTIKKCCKSRTRSIFEDIKFELDKKQSVDATFTNI